MMHPPPRSHTAAVAAWVVVALALFACTTPHTVVLAQNYQPVSFASSAVALKKLYLYGGITDLSSTTSYTSQFVSVSLKSSFKCSNPPWETEPATVKSAYAPSLADSDGRIIVAGGRNDSGLAPVALFDGESTTWTQAPYIPGEEPQSMNPPRNSPGMVYDTILKNIVLFGGSNSAVSNEINYFDPEELTWKLSGPLTGIPGLYAPIMYYIHQHESILIMGGCTELNSSTGLPTKCADFRSAYLVSSKAAALATSTSQILVTKVNLTAGADGFPAPRFMPCTITLGQDAIFMHGGGDPDKALSDAWVLNPDTWVWAKRPISGAPGQGLMGHTCEYGFREQILVVGGHQGGEFVKNSISVILMKDWSWQDKFLGSKDISEPVKIGLGISVAIVVGAIIAGLVIKRKRDLARRRQEKEHRDSEATGPSSDQVQGDDHHQRECKEHKTKHKKDSYPMHSHTSGSGKHGGRQHGKQSRRSTRQSVDKLNCSTDTAASAVTGTTLVDSPKQHHAAPLTTSPPSTHSGDTSPFSDKYKEQTPPPSITQQDTQSQ